MVSSLSNIPFFEQHSKIRFITKDSGQQVQIVESISNLADSILKLDNDFNIGEVSENSISYDFRNHD